MKFKESNCSCKTCIENRVLFGSCIFLDKLGVRRDVISQNGMGGTVYENDEIELWEAVGFAVIAIAILVAVVLYFW